MSDIFSFRLLEDFVNKYKDTEPPFGFSDAGNNSLGEITFIRTYSRVKEDGTLLPSASPAKALYSAKASVPSL